MDVRCEETVKAAPDQLWAYVVEGYFANHPRWDPAIVGMEKTSSGPLGKGTQGTETRKFLGKAKAAFEVTEFEAPTRFALRNTSGPFAVDRAYTLEQAGDGTRLTFDFSMSPKGPMKLFFPLLANTIAGQVRANIARIPGLLGAASA